MKWASLMYPHLYWGRFNVCLWLMASIVTPLASAAGITAERTVFTYRNSESASDQRFDYDTAALRLALEKTSHVYGPYLLIPSPVMNVPRATLSAKRDQFPNFMLKLSYSASPDHQGLAYAPFPVDLGVVGYRVCFTNPKHKTRLLRVKNLRDLQAYNFGVGSGWAEIDIYKANQLKHVESPLYTSLFTMLANDRFSLFCRGANEVLSEFNNNRNVANFSLNKSFALHYTLPRFFYSSAANTAALERVNIGLRRAYKDGSLIALWQEHYQESVNFANLPARRIIKIKNPALKNFNTDLEQFFYDPFSTSLNSINATSNNTKEHRY